MKKYIIYYGPNNDKVLMRYSEKEEEERLGFRNKTKIWQKFKDCFDMKSKEYIPEMSGLKKGIIIDFEAETEEEAWLIYETI